MTGSSFTGFCARERFRSNSGQTPGFSAHQEAPPNQGTDVPKHYSKLIKVCHLRSLQDPTRKRHNLSPRNLPLSRKTWR
jgi:hypothetical protein